MKIDVRYYTQTGNSKKLADSIAKELGVVAKSIDEPMNEKADLAAANKFAKGFCE